MTLGKAARRLSILLAAITLVATACSAAATVTIDEAAATSATSTALREEAGRSALEPATQDDAPEPTQVATDGAGTTSETPGLVRPGDADCTFVSIDDFNDIQIELSFTNSLADQGDATLNYDIFDGNAELVGSSTVFLEELAPGERVRMEHDTFTDAPTDPAARDGISCELIAIESSAFGFEKFDPGPADSCVFVEIDSFGDVQIRLNVVSPLAASAELAIDYALRGPDDVRFSDGVSFTDVVNPGEPSTTATDTVTELPAWVDESTVSCQVLSIQEF